MAYIRIISMLLNVYLSITYNKNVVCRRESWWHAIRKKNTLKIVCWKLYFAIFYHCLRRYWEQKPVERCSGKVSGIVVCRREWLRCTCTAKFCAKYLLIFPSTHRKIVFAALWYNLVMCEYRVVHGISF